MDAVQLIVSSCLPDPSFARSAALDSKHPALSTGTDDRISSLPGNLLSNIISRLPIKDAVRTTVLSHRWRRVWPSTPLILDDRHLLPSSEQRLVNIVSRIFLTHPGPFHSVRLTLGFFDFHHPEVEFWPRLFAEKDVRQLVWINRPPPIYLQLSAGMFRCASLRILYLGFWKLPHLDLVNLPQHQQHAFPVLRELVICHCSMDSINLALILKHSPLLSNLSFVSSYGTPKLVKIQKKSTLQSILFWCSNVDGLTVQGSPRLRRLILWNASAALTLAHPMEVKIASASPSLTEVGFLEPGVHKLQIGGTLIEPHTEASPSTVVPSVKVLALKVHWVKNLVNMMPSFLICFPNIETLHIESGKEEGVPVGKLNWLRARSVNCITHMKTLVFHEFKGGRSEISFLKLVAEHGCQLRKLVILLSSECLLSVKDTKLKVDAAIGCAQWANADCELFFCTFKEPGHTFTFQEASDLTIRDPFFELPSM